MLATGHYRNGILLAPITAEAVARARPGAPASGGPGAHPGRFAGETAPGLVAPEPREAPR